MDPASGTRQALAEIALDVEEGADMVIVKPGLPYLDLVSAAYENTLVPVVAYNSAANMRWSKRLLRTAGSTKKPL